MATPFLIVGLGNPGKEYEGTRHNAGREALDALARNGEWGMENGEFRAKAPLHAEMLEGALEHMRIILAKPTTFMNESGKAVAALVRHYQFAILHSQFLLIHDDLDLTVGTLRLSVDGSSGGQKGVQSIIEALGTGDFLRLRIGIGPNATPEGVRIPAENFVLKRFSAEERPKIDAAIARAVEVVTALLREGLPAAQVLASSNS